jgi:hypothetical protein
LTEFLRSVRIGPAVEGSYVLTLHTPVPPRLSGPSTLFDGASPGLPEDEPIQRRVSLQMYQAVRAAHQAADAALLSTDGLEPFAVAVNEGVSANLCEALAGLGGSSGHPFEFAVSLAAARRDSVTPVRFRRDHIPVLREAAVEFRARTPEDDVTITGEVVRLYREGASGGEITVVGRVEDAEILRRIWLDLSAVDYQAAMLAHGEMRQVAVRGNLVRRGTRFYLSGASGFQVLADTGPE